MFQPRSLTVEVDAEEEIEEEIEVSSPSPARGAQTRAISRSVAELPANRGYDFSSPLHQFLAQKDAEQEEQYGCFEDSDDLSARLTEHASLGSTSGSLSTSTDGGSGCLAHMMQAAAAAQMGMLEESASTPEELQALGLAHLIPLQERASAVLPASKSSSFSVGRPFGLAAPPELEMPDDRSSGSAPSTEGSPQVGTHARSCTPVLRRARMRSPDEEGVLSTMPEEGERPGRNNWRRRPWHTL
jgi:hypothetical protein